jgi:alpha-tubulin suppressor-like RCC1 family protein
MDQSNILKINVQNKIIKVKQFSKFHFVNIILSIIEYNLNLKSNIEYFDLIYKDVDINYKILFKFLKIEFKNKKNTFINLNVFLCSIFFLRIWERKAYDEQMAQWERAISPITENNEPPPLTGDDPFENEIALINRIKSIYNEYKANISKLLYLISKDIDSMGVSFTKQFNKNALIIIYRSINNIFTSVFLGYSYNKYNITNYVDTFDKFNIILEKDINRFNKLFKKIIKQIDHINILEQLKNKSKNKNISGALKYIDIKNNKIYEILPKIKFVKILTSDNHCVALTTNGSIYTWGSNTYGQLGLGIKEDNKVNEPTRCGFFIENNIKIIYISIGYSTTSIITEDNNLYSSGCTENGRIGIKIQNTHFINKFTKINIKYKISKIESGSTHQCSIDEDSHIYSWGSKYYIGSSRPWYKDSYNPNMHIYYFKNKNILIDKISIGQGGYHTFALSKSGLVYGWGHNGTWLLGHENYNSRNDSSELIHTLPVKLKKLDYKYKIKDIICGWSCTYILDYTGNIYISGQNNEGQLGIHYSKCTYDSGKYKYLLGKHETINNIDKIYNFKETVFLVNFNKKVYSVGNINKYTSFTQSNNLIEPWKTNIIEQIKNSIDIDFQMSKKKIYFIE